MSAINYTQLYYEKCSAPQLSNESIFAEDICSFSWLYSRCWDAFLHRPVEDDYKRVRLFNIYFVLPVCLLTASAVLYLTGSLFREVLHGIETDPSNRTKVNIGGLDGYFVPQRNQKNPCDPEYVLVE
jgi:hypothetical protein